MFVVNAYLTHICIIAYTYMLAFLFPTNIREHGGVM